MKPRVALFVPCLTAELEPATGLKMADLLEAAGFEVLYPEGQTCCGQPWFNTGYREGTLPFARHFLKIFSEVECDYIVSPSGSCAGMVKHHYPDLDLEPADLERHARVAAKLHDFTEFFASHAPRFEFRKSVPLKVYFHPSCHLTREMKVGDAPLELLRRIEGLEVATDTEPLCCGFGGTFSVKMPDLSAAMTKRKVEQILAEHNPDRLIIPDASCLLQIRGWMRKHGLGLKVDHLIDFLHEHI